MFRKLVASDEAVKTIFDHFRNIGIAGAILAAGVWTLKNQPSGLLAWVGLASGIALCALGFFLLFIAERHGHKKLEESKIHPYLKFVVSVVYGLTLFSLFTVAAQRIELH